MRRTILFSTLTLLIASSSAFAQSNPTFVPFRGAAKGALYKPDRGAAHIGVLIMHRTSNVMAGIPTEELPKRGFMVLAMNPRFDNNEAIVEWEKIALDVKDGVEYLRKQPGITKVVLYGGSGGGPTMSFYQAVAEKGVKFCQDPKKLTQCGNELAGLPPADGIIFRDAHPGNPVNAIRHMNPSVMDEDARKIDSSLDPFDPKNGYNPKGDSHYSEDFKQRYFKAQAARMSKLIQNAQKRMEEIKAGKGGYPDDDAFIIPRGEGARLTDLDPTVASSTLKPHRLLKNDGTIVTQVIKTVRVGDPETRKTNIAFRTGAHFLTLESFLSANAIRGTHSMDDLDHCSSNNSTVCALQSISVPVLITAMGGWYFIRDNEIHYDVAASKDKEFIVLEGALHGIEPCTKCEKTPGQYSNTVKNYFDYLAKWLNERF